MGYDLKTTSIGVGWSCNYLDLDLLSRERRSLERRTDEVRPERRRDPDLRRERDRRRSRDLHTNITLTLCYVAYGGNCDNI